MCGVGDGSELQIALGQWTGQRTVPNVFIGGNHIGGCDGTRLNFLMLDLYLLYLLNVTTHEGNWVLIFCCFSGSQILLPSTEKES